MISLNSINEFDGIKIDDFLNYPCLSKSSNDILSNIEPTLPKTAKTLIDRVISIKETKIELLIEKNFGNINKVLAVLKTSLIVSLLSASIFLGMTTSILASILLLFIAPFWLCMHIIISADSAKKLEDVDHLGKSLPNNLYNGLPTEIISALGAVLPILPLYEAYTKEYRLNNILENLKKSTEPTLSHDLFEIYSNYNESLLEKLNIRINQLKTDLSMKKGLAARSSYDEMNVAVSITLHEKARDELAQMIEFYKQLEQSQLQQLPM